MRPASVRPDHKPEHLRWTRVKIECNKELKGWLAGPVFGAEGHNTKAFKPCHHKLTRGLRVCPWCAIPQFAAIRYQGYLPMYDERLNRVVVCVNLDVSLTCDKLEPLAPIHLKKGKFPTSPIVLNTTPWTELKPTGRNVSNRPQDILPWLISVLWKQEHLDDIIECQPVVSEPVKQHAAAVARADEPPADKPESIAEAKKKLKEWREQRQAEQEAEREANGETEQTSKPKKQKK